jgi:hypothetical protein
MECFAELVFLVDIWYFSRNSAVVGDVHELGAGRQRGDLRADYQAVQPVHRVDPCREARNACGRC